MLTDKQRAALAALPVGGVETLVNRVGGHHYIRDGIPILVATRSGYDPRTDEHPLDPPHGKPGDVITESVNLLPYRFRVENVEVEKAQLCVSCKPSLKWLNNNQEGGMSEYDPVESLRTEVERFKATNQFNPLSVTQMYVQAGLVLHELDEARDELAAMERVIEDVRLAIHLDDPASRIGPSLRALDAIKGGEE